MATCWIRDNPFPGIFLLLCLSALALGGCDMHAESKLNHKRLQVREEKVTEEVSVSRMDQNYIANVAQDYGQNGRGPVNVTITYDPQSKKNTAMRAGDEAARISKAFRAEGIQNVVTGILPVREQGDEAVAILSYSSYKAAPPDNCGTIPGLERPVLEHDPGYRLGCSVETIFARQIANPSDLLGDAQPTAYTDGRPAVNKVDAYRTGAQNRKLRGESASD